ncbi:hypothetical protein [Raineya sp.]
MRTFIFQVACIILLTKPVLAQNYFGLLNTGKNTVSIGVNANPNLNANTDYLFNFESPNQWIERWGLVAQANFPLFSQKGFDFDLRLGAGTLLNLAGNFKAISGISWNFSRTADINGRYFHSGFKLDILPGFYSNKWVFATHLAMQYQPWLHIKHSDYAKQTFEDLYPSGSGQYSKPKNGWFYQNHITFQTGIGIAYSQPKWHLNLTAGFQHQPNQLRIVSLPDIGIMPFYGGINFGYSIQKN